MGDTVKAGNHVAWETAHGKTKGMVEKKLTSSTTIKGHTAKATKDDPQHLLKSDKTGAKAAHKPGDLKKA